MTYLYALASIGILTSSVANKQKTVKALKMAWGLFIKMLPMLLITLSMVSIILYFFPDDVIAKYLGTNDLLLGALFASLIGAISLLPGFITFPLCGLLREQGVSYTVLGAFTTSLMMVGIVTYPIEKKYFGAKLTIIRNLAAYTIALMVSAIIGIIYMEVQ
ncbi:permease [Fusibacter paucivorans]|uniref:Permease n=1 Tax=Fusibacter paucivorans TaxID=76009 RepID=A0ABS5PT79_9FIRM|nr:permease [Fusibacter paucivorans]MBS7528383.1 permease [Fusibacter paucivorans]